MANSQLLPIAQTVDAAANDKDGWTECLWRGEPCKAKIVRARDFPHNKTIEVWIMVVNGRGGWLPRSQYAIHPETHQLHFVGRS